MEDFSTTLSANGLRADGSRSVLYAKKTVPIAPLPRTFNAFMLSSSSFSGGDGDGEFFSIAGLREVEGEKEWMRRNTMV